MNSEPQWPSRECVESIPDLARGMCRFLRANLRLSDEPADVPFKSPHAVDRGIDREIDRLSYPFYSRSVAQYEADRRAASEVGWPYAIANYILATPREEEMQWWLDPLRNTPFRAAIAGGPHFLHSTSYGWDNEVSACLDSLFEAVATIRIYFGKGPVFSREHWVEAADWLWQRVNPMLTSGRPILTCNGKSMPREPWFTYPHCRSPQYGAKLPKRLLAPIEQDNPIPVPNETVRHGTRSQPITEGFPAEWLDRLESLADSLENATVDSSSLSRTSPLRSTSAVENPTTALQLLAAKFQAEREDRQRAAADGEQHYREVVQPYDTAWLDLEDLATCDAAVTAERLTSLAAAGERAGKSGWLAWLPDSEPAKADPVTQGIALAIRGAVAAKRCHLDDAAALVTMIGGDCVASRVLKLRRARLAETEDIENESGDKSAIIARSKSPLSQYVNVLVTVPDHLERLLNRDAEAIRILSVDPALPEALARADRWYWDRYRERTTGGRVRSRRIWTRRDEEYVNWRRGYRAGCAPACRAARYLGWLESRRGASLHDQWFRLTLNESREDGMAVVLAPKLEQAKATYERMMTAVRSVVQDDGGRSDFDDAKIGLGQLTCELMNYTKAPRPESPEILGAHESLPKERSAEPQAPSNTKRKGKPGPKTDDKTDAQCHAAVEAYRSHCEVKRKRAIKADFWDWYVTSPHDLGEKVATTENFYKRAKNYADRLRQGKVAELSAELSANG